MKLAELHPATREKIAACRYDRFLSKHEGPESWASELEYGRAEFMEIGGSFDVLLPVDQGCHPNITVLRCVPGPQNQSLTLFLKDTTYVSDVENEIFDAGRIAICERVRGESFYIATVYHSWFIIENEPIANSGR